VANEHGDKSTTATTARDEILSLDEFALFVMTNAEDEEDLDTLDVIFSSMAYLTLGKLLSFPSSGGEEDLQASSSSTTISFQEKKNLFKTALQSKLSTENVYKLIFRGVAYRHDSKITRSQAICLFYSTDQLRTELKLVFENQVQKTIKYKEYIRYLVHVDNEVAISFPTDVTKSEAFIISGESGSGKSWFAKQYIPNKFPEASIIYYELSDDDMTILDMETFKMTEVYEDCIRALRDVVQPRSKVFKAVGDLLQKNYSDRDRFATNMMVECVGKALRSSDIASSWWDSLSNKAPCKKLDQLIIIFDEVGKNLDFTLGLVEEVRNILMNIQYKGLAEDAMLVLVGTGLDGLFDHTSPDFSIVTKTKFQDNGARWPIWIGPSKEAVIIVRGPTLDNRVIQGVKLDDIKRGTYSNILATNTRMLFRGVIPIMTDEKLIMSVEDISSRRIQLGSTNIMRHASIYS
jgi:hypothetical protein